MVVTQLKDATTRWLRPTMDDGQRIIKLVVIEQILSILPPCIHHWLASWKPEHLSDSLELWDSFAAADGREQSGRGEGGRPFQGGPGSAPGQKGLEQNNAALRGRARFSGGWAQPRWFAPIPVTCGGQSDVHRIPQDEARPSDPPTASEGGLPLRLGVLPQAPVSGVASGDTGSGSAPSKECDLADNPQRWGWDEAW